METFAFIIILIIHWIADFVLQSEKWSLGKSSHWKPLLSHTATYSIVWLIPIYLMTADLAGAFLFTLITFVAHTITDYYTSRVVKEQFKMRCYYTPLPNFGGFTTIGFDQLLHYTQLFLSWHFIFNN